MRSRADDGGPEDLTQSVIAALDMLASKRVSTLDKKHSNLPIYR